MGDNNCYTSVVESSDGGIIIKELTAKSPEHAIEKNKGSTIILIKGFVPNYVFDGQSHPINTVHPIEEKIQNLSQGDILNLLVRSPMSVRSTFCANGVKFLEKTKIGPDDAVLCEWFKNEMFLLLDVPGYILSETIKKQK